MNNVTLKSIRFGQIPAVIDADPVLRAAYEKGYVALAARNAIEITSDPASLAAWSGAQREAGRLFQEARKLFNARFCAF